MKQPALLSFFLEDLLPLGETMLPRPVGMVPASHAVLQDPRGMPKQIFVLRTFRAGIESHLRLMNR
jgi:hypothetical protein